jgi:hypothetical protein
MRNVLRQNQHDCADDVALVSIPHGRLAKQDAATGWQTRLIEPPAAQLAPIHRNHICVGRRHGYIVGSFFAKDANRERRDGFHLVRLIAPTAADDTGISAGIRPSCRWARWPRP